MIRHTILGLGAVATSALGLLVVPLAGAQAAQPTCTILDLDFTETDATVSHPWNLQCANPTETAESATFQAFQGTAKSPGDFIAFGGTLPVPPGLSTLPILIDIVGDDTGEPTDRFEIRFEDPEGVIQFRDRFDTGEQAISYATIDDDDGFTVTSLSRSVPEGDVGSSVAEIEVTLSDPVDRPFDVLFYTQDGTATAGSDYEETRETLTFAPGAVSRLTSITILGDEEDETDEYVFLGLGIEGTGTLQSGGLNILDDDEGGGGTGPCITISETAVSVSGPPSTASTRGFAGPLPRLTMTNCGDSATSIDVRGTHATGSGATWELTNASSGGAVDSTCELGTDLYRADVTVWLSGGGGIGTPLTTSARPLLGPDGTTPLEIDPADSREISPQIELPCEGSAGLQQPMTMNVVLTAVEP